MKKEEEVERGRREYVYWLRRSQTIAPEVLSRVTSHLARSGDRRPRGNAAFVRTNLRRRS